MERGEFDFAGGMGSEPLLRSPYPKAQVRVPVMDRRRRTGVQPKPGNIASQVTDVA